MNNITFAPQSLTLFRRKVSRDNGETVTFWDAKLSSVPKNDDGVTQAEFTGRDLAPDMIKRIADLKVSSGTSKNGEQYICCGLVKISADIADVHTFTRRDGTEAVAYRITPTAIERAVDESDAELAKLLA